MVGTWILNLVDHGVAEPHVAEAMMGICRNLLGAAEYPPCEIPATPTLGFVHVVALAGFIPILDAHAVLSGQCFVVFHVAFLLLRLNQMRCSGMSNDTVRNEDRDMFVILHS